MNLSKLEMMLNKPIPYKVKSKEERKVEILKKVKEKKNKDKKKK